MLIDMKSMNQTISSFIWPPMIDSDYQKTADTFLNIRDFLWSDIII